jgi:hypothetical protein
LRVPNPQLAEEMMDVEVSVTGGMNRPSYRKEPARGIESDHVERSEKEQNH